MNPISNDKNESFRLATRTPIEGEPPTKVARVDPNASEPNKTLSMKSVQKLPSGIFLKLVLDYLPPKDWNSLGRSFPEMSQYLNHKSANHIWPAFHQELKAKYPNVTNLDELGARKLLGFPEGPESIESFKRSTYILIQAIRMLKHSEDFQSTILTIPPDWSIDKLEAISQAAVNAQIHSAKIRYGHDSREEAFKEAFRRNHPMKEAQTIVLSNTLIQGSRNQSIAEQEALLKARGFKEECPDGLSVLTAAVVARIVTKGGKSLYGWASQLSLTYTRTNTKTPEGWTLMVGSSTVGYCPQLSYVSVHDNNSDSQMVGVGALRTFAAIPS